MPGRWTPATIRRNPLKYTVFTADRTGWQPTRLETFITAANADGFRAFDTADRNMPKKVNLRTRRIAVSVLTGNNRPSVVAHVEAIFCSDHPDSFGANPADRNAALQRPLTGHLRPDNCPPYNTRQEPAVGASARSWMDDAQDAFADVHDPIPEEEHLKTASPNALATAATSSANSRINCASPNASSAPPMPVLGSGQAPGLDDPVDMHRGSTCGINPATEGDPVGSALAGETQDGDDNGDEEKITAPPKLTSDRKAREVLGSKMLTPPPENHGENHRQMDTPRTRPRSANTRNSWSASPPRAAWGPSTGRRRRISSKNRTNQALRNVM